MLLMVQSSLKKLLDERTEIRPKVDANVCMREASFLIRTLSSAIKNNEGDS